MRAALSADYNAFIGSIIGLLIGPIAESITP